MQLKITFGVPENQRVKVARLFYEAFESEFREIFGPKKKGISIISRHLRDDRTVVAINKGVIVGFAGLKFGGKGFIDISFRGLLREHKFGILKMLFFSCGFIIFRQIWMFLKKPREKEMLLEALVVAENMRGKKIGSRLLRFVIDFGRSRGYEQIRLFVIDVNVKAKRFYERMGFENTRVYKVIFPWNKIFGFNATNEMIYKI